MQVQIGKSRVFGHRRRNKIWISFISLMFFALGLFLFLIGWILPQFRDLFDPIGVEIMGGAIMFYLIDHLWQHPHDVKNSYRIEEILERLELHRTTEATHITESAAHMETLQKLVKVEQLSKRKLEPVLSWFLVGLLSGVVGVLIFGFKKR